MATKVTNNLKLKLLSLGAAILVWIVVVNISDPVRTRTFTNIPVTIVNDSAITSEGKVYEILDDSDEVTIEVVARRSVKLSRDDFKAVADMTNIQLMKYVPIDVTCSKPSEIQSISLKTPNLQINIEDSDSKILPIVVRTTGRPGNGYIVDKNTTFTSPESVRITGASSAIGKVSKACVDVDVSGITMDTERTCSLIVYDANGDVIKNSSLSFNVDIDNITASVALLATKTVKIKVSSSGTVAPGYRLTKLTCEPSTILLAGKEEDLEGIEEIVIPGEAMDISRANADLEKVVEIADYLPDEITIPEEDDGTVAISATVEKLENQEVSLSKNKIMFENVPDGFEATFFSDNDLVLQTRALQNQIEALNVDTWDAVVDLSGCSKEGTYEVVARVFMQDGYELAEDPIVVVVLKKK